MAEAISVVIPTYNRASYLPATIQSILAQSLPVAEILIVDDGSRDDTADLVPRLEGPIRYLQQQNQGPAAARNRGIRAATGALIALLDSDDLWEPDKLRMQVKALSGREVGMVHTAARIMNAQGQLTGAIWSRPEYHGDVFHRLLIANGVNASSVLARRDLLLEVGGYDERFPCLENWELWLRLSRRTRFAYLDTPLIRYRVHPGNLIKDLARQRQAYQLLLDKHLEGSNPPELLVRRAAYARYHRAFADALVGQGQYRAAIPDFLQSLFYEPFQPQVWWKVFRVSTARPPAATLG